MSQELTSMAEALKVERSSRATETTALDSLMKRLVEVRGGSFEEQDDADVMQAAGRELERLEKQRRDVQGRAALCESKLSLKVGKATMEVEELRVSRTRMSLELQGKGSEIDELQKEARLRGNQLLELIETTTAARSARDEAMKERDIALGRAQVAEQKLLQASEHARQAEARAESSQRICKGLKRDLRLARHNIQLAKASAIDARMSRAELDCLTELPNKLLVVIIVKVTDGSIFNLLSLREVCRTLREVSAESVVCCSCPIGELPNLAESPIQVKRFCHGVAVNEVGSSRGTYLSCMLELVTDEVHTAKVERIYHLLHRLKGSYEMAWLSEATIFVFRREWGHRIVIKGAEWPHCLGDPDPDPVLGQGTSGSWISARILPWAGYSWKFVYYQDPVFGRVPMGVGPLPGSCPGQGTRRTLSAARILSWDRILAVKKFPRVPCSGQNPGRGPTPTGTLPRTGSYQRINSHEYPAQGRILVEVQLCLGQDSGSKQIP
ncbi:hypothetical protein CJ030_MR4G001644 [Morella rubra]|uniref:Uncharacterized protein n=1 Tax=Morella rubra TaxID=262757 RepID=A0A6A1VRN2_9ROSI|nr:hypothetical protein CJ030_MR4G001644 [Morella rubra]